LEQQAKERLTGGVILVMLLVLLVPELLTGPRLAPPPLQAQPDQAPMRSYTMDLGESPHANGAPVAASTTVPVATEAAVTASGPRPAPPAIAATSSSAPPAATQVPAESAPTTPAAAHTAAPDHTAGTWTVQLGTFGSRDNAAHLVATLKSHGFSASIAEAKKNGHKLFRVRVGAERDRAAAQKLLLRLKAAGEKGGEIVPR